MFCYFCFFNGALNYVDIYFEVMFTRLSALRKLLVYTAYKKCSFDLQKNSVESLNFKTKVIDNVPK